MNKLDIYLLYKKYDNLTLKFKKNHIDNLKNISI
jgi:hypothetical protein